MSRQTHLIKNTLVIALGKLSTQFLSVLLLPLYTHYLSVSDFGKVDLIVTYIALLAPVATLQVEMAVFRFLVDARGSKKKKKHIISTAIKIAELALICTLLAYVVTTHFISIPHARLLLPAIAATITVNLFMQIARGLGHTSKYAVAGMIAGVSTIATNILFVAVLGWGVKGMLSSIVIANTLASLYVFFALKLYHYIDIKINDGSTKKQMLQYSIPLIPNGLAWWAINAADRTIIAIMLGATSNGLYAVAYKFPLIFTSLFSFFSLSWQETASVHINSSDRDKFFSSTIDASLRFFASLGAIMIAAMPFVFSLLVNKRYSEAYLYIPILILGAYFNSIVGLYSAVYIAKKMTRQVANTSIVAAIIGVGFTLIFTPVLGLYAASIAMAIAYATMALYRALDIRRYMLLKYRPKTLALVCTMFTISIILYYVQQTIADIVNAALTTCLSLYLNKRILTSAKSMILSNRHSKYISQDPMLGS